MDIVSAMEKALDKNAYMQRAGSPQTQIFPTRSAYCRLIHIKEDGAALERWAPTTAEITALDWEVGGNA